MKQLLVLVFFFMPLGALAQTWQESACHIDSDYAVCYSIPGCIVCVLKDSKGVDIAAELTCDNNQESGHLSQSISIRFENGKVSVLELVKRDYVRSPEEKALKCDNGQYCDIFTKHYLDTVSNLPFEIQEKFYGYRGIGPAADE